MSCQLGNVLLAEKGKEDSEFKPIDVLSSFYPKRLSFSKPHSFLFFITLFITTNGVPALYEHGGGSDTNKIWL